MNGTYCLGVFNKKAAHYLRSMCKDSPQCTVYLTLRGRGPRKEHGKNMCQDLPLKYADKVAVYAKPKPKYQY